MSKRLLSEFLKEKRTLAGLTQAEVAEKLGYTTAQFISNWERGISNPPISTIKKICQLYKVSNEEVYEIVLAQSIQEVTDSLRAKFSQITKEKKERSS
jgi:transcriptional regulator with XRE-family HTH domain